MNRAEIGLLRSYGHLSDAQRTGQQNDQTHIKPLKHRRALARPVTKWHCCFNLLCF